LVDAETGRDTWFVAALGPIVDCNVHLWDQRENPVFWLTDRTLVRDLIGDYDSLPDVYTLADYGRETVGFDVRGIVWSDAGAANPVAAAEWVRAQHQERGLVTGIVSLGDPTAEGFSDLIDRLLQISLVRSVRVRLAAGLVQGDRSEPAFLEQPGVMESFGLMARHELVATVEATSDQLPVLTRLARELPELKIVVDHFGWPTDLTDTGMRVHLDRLGDLAARPNVATRIDAIGTIFGAWSTERVRPWLLAIVDLFGPDRCMLGSDLPIERLRSGFEPLYRAFDEIFAAHAPPDREMLLCTTAERWYGSKHPPA